MTKAGNHSPDNVKFHDNSTTFPWRFAALLPMLRCNTAWSKTKMKCTSSAKSRMSANMQLTMNSFRQLFPDKIFSLTLPWLLVKSLTFPWQLSNSLTHPGFPDKWSPCKRHLNITLLLLLLLLLLVVSIVKTEWHTLHSRNFWGEMNIKYTGNSFLAFNQQCKPHKSEAHRHRRTY